MKQDTRTIDRDPRPFEVAPAPQDGQRLTSTPPVFVWPPEEGVAEYVLQYSPEPDFRGPSAVTVRKSTAGPTVRTLLPFGREGQVHLLPDPPTLHIPPETLRAGVWHWRYGFSAGTESVDVFSRTRTFIIDGDAIALPYPDIKQVIARASGQRPRILVTPDQMARWRDLGRSDLRAPLDVLKEHCSSFLGEPLLPEPRFLPPGPDRMAQYTRVFREVRPFLRAMSACAEAYLLSGAEDYGLEAKRRLLHVVGWDPGGSTSLGHNDEPGTEIVRLGPRVYDYIYPLLAGDERDRCRRCFAPRMEQLYFALKARPFEVNPFESHAMGYYLEDLTEACLAMAGEIGVEAWLGYCLKLAWAPTFPPYGGSGGGWSEGPSYWGWSIGVFLRLFRLIEQFTGLPVHERPWLRETGYYKLYANPPYSQMSPFGDGHARPAGRPGAMWELAQTFRNPHFKWYADQQQVRPSGIEAFRSHGEHVEACPPLDLPQARCFHDVGLACMHTNLADGENNVQLLLRSSPYGAISHSYADQNAFTLDAFGQPLAISSGYYPYYGSPHHTQWANQTKAANAIGVDGEGQHCEKWSGEDWAAKGRIVRFHTDDYCHYALADASRAYQGRLRRCFRHVVFLRPLDADMAPVIIICDDLESTRRSTFQWWLHSLEKMQIDASRQLVRLRREEARLDATFLLPDGLQFSQTDQFDVQPEGGFPDQWHLTAETTHRDKTGVVLVALLPYRSHQEQEHRTVELARDGDHIGAEVASQGRRHQVWIRTGHPCSRTLAPGRSADVSAVSWNSDGDELGSVSLVVG